MFEKVQLEIDQHMTLCERNQFIDISIHFLLNYIQVAVEIL